MDSQAFQYLTQFPIPIPHHHYILFTNTYVITKTRRQLCFSGGSRWDWEKNVNPNRRSRFGQDYVTDDYDEDDEFSFRNRSKQRTWWSDDFNDEEEEDEGFGILEASIGFNWVLKIFRAFGWMVPAILISLLLGNGPNTMVMALALPLAQSALSLAADTFWDKPDDSPRPKSKSKKRPFAKARGQTRARKRKESSTKTSTGNNYKTWVDTDNGSNESKTKKMRNFGGWDELDNQVRVNYKTPIETVDDERVEERVKISRRIKGDTPLVVRLLIAVFPFLGSWMKLL